MTDGGFGVEDAAGGFVGMFLRISSYKSRIKSSLNRPNVEHAVAKPVRLGWSMANWQTFRARRSFGVIKLRTLVLVDTARETEGSIP